MTNSVNFLPQTVVPTAWANDVDAAVYDYVINVKNYGVVGDNSTDDSVAMRLAFAAGAGKTIYIPAGTYLLSTADSGAYLTLSTAGTKVIMDRAAKLRFTDAAVYGINITAQQCTIIGGMLWGTNTTAPTITALVHVNAPITTLQDINFAYASIAVHNKSYIFRSLNNAFSNCDRYFYTSGGNTADVMVVADSYGTTHIGTNAVVEIAGSGGADIHARWEMMDQTKRAVSIATTGQRVVLKGKIENSGGIYVGPNVICRAEIEMLDSYTGTVGIELASGGGTLDVTGSWLNGPGITSGVTGIKGDSIVIMGSGRLTQWQVGVDANSVVSMGDVLIDQCTTGVDVATAASGKVGPLIFSGNTTNYVRTSSATVNIPDLFVGSSTGINPSSLADGAGETITITVTGALAGDTAEVSFSNDLQGVLMFAWVTADTLNIRFQNETGGTVDLASGTVRYRISSKAA